MLINSYQFAAAYDTDAQTYINAVEAADGQALEIGVKDAINAFVVGCKDDGIWTPNKASCILAGARTLAGALVPLVGTAPTSFNFVSADYNRKTGLAGNASTKYLASNRANNADPQNNRHLSVYASTLGSAVNHGYIGTVSTSGGSFIANSGSAGQIGARLASSTGINNATVYGTGFLGINRSSSTTVILQGKSTSVSVGNTSAAPISNGINIFVIGTSYGNARIAFYSIGESLDLALLDARVTTLINALAAAIP